MKNKIVEFTAKPAKCNYSTESFKIYACEVSAEEAFKNNLKSAKWGDRYTVLGDLHELVIGVPYKIRAKEEVNGTYGAQYKVINIEREVPNSKEDTRKFLEEVLTYEQTTTLLDVYPDIVDKVMNNNLGDIDLSKTKGIKEASFEIIKRKIIENFAFAKIIIAFDGLISFSMLKKLYDAYPSIDRIKEELIKDPYKCLCGLSRVGFRTADSIILRLQKMYKKIEVEGKEPFIYFDYEIKFSPQRLKAAIIFTLEESEKSGHTHMKIKNMKEELYSLCPKALVHLSEVILNNRDDIYLNKKGEIALTKTYTRATFVAHKVYEALNADVPKWDFKDLENYRTTEYGELTDEQFSLLDIVMNNNITLLSGVAGSGKTTTIEKLIELLKDNNIMFSIFAPTGRAAKVIAQYTGESASTIHRGLEYRPGDGFGRNALKPLYANLVIIDESSMADLWLIENLLRAIDFKNTRLLLIGDPAQLPSVGCGNILHDMIESKKIPIVNLTKVFRYGIGGISTVATKVRKREAYLEKDIKGSITLGEDKGFTFIPANNNSITKVLEVLYFKLLDKGVPPEDIMVITSYNKGDIGTIKINKKLQVLANPYAAESDFNKIFKVGDQNYYENDLVIQNVNNYNAKKYVDKDLKRDLTNYDDYDNKKKEEEVFIANGDIGVVEKVEDNKIIIRFDDATIIYTKSEAINLKLAYCISTHKSQGGQCKYVIFLTPTAHTYMLNSNLIYVGITRTQERCYQIGEPSMANKAVRKKANLERNTNLPNLLANEEFAERMYQKYCVEKEEKTLEYIMKKVAILSEKREEKYKEKKNPKNTDDIVDMFNVLLDEELPF